MSLTIYSANPPFADPKTDVSGLDKTDTVYDLIYRLINSNWE